jgi:hypothetical protein
MQRFDLRRHAPVVVIVLLVVGPLAIWAATSGGSGDADKKGLVVERGVSLTGAQELVVSIAGDAQVTTGATSVRIECDDSNGRPIIKTTQPWPFINEPGYPYPHAHVADKPENVEGSRRCRVLGTDTRLEGKVQ